MGTGGTVLLVTSDRLGEGADELGRILMKSFLNTVWDSETKPERIIFLNAGVRLAVEDSEVLDTLALLEASGVAVLSCGTCLDYYNLREKLKAGQVTNMKAIVASLLNADRVIRV